MKIFGRDRILKVAAITGLGLETGPGSDRRFQFFGSVPKPESAISGEAGRTPISVSVVNLVLKAPIPLLMAFQSLQHLLFGLEPIIEFRARLIAALDVEFVSATLNLFFERKRLDRGFPCFRRCRHGITSGQETSTADGQTEGRTDGGLALSAAILIACPAKNVSG